MAPRSWRRPLSVGWTSRGGSGPTPARRPRRCVSRYSRYPRRGRRSRRALGHVVGPVRTPATAGRSTSPERVFPIPAGYPPRQPHQRYRATTNAGTPPTVRHPWIRRSRRRAPARTNATRSGRAPPRSRAPAPAPPIRNLSVVKFCRQSLEDGVFRPIQTVDETGDGKSIERSVAPGIRSRAPRPDQPRHGASVVRCL